MSDDVLKISGLTKKFPEFQLGPLNLNVPRGSIYGFVGPNGAGKTTTLELIFGIGRNDGGTISVFGLDHQRDDVAIKRRAAYASPNLSFSIWRKVGRAIRFVRGFYPDWDDAYCSELMKMFGLGAEDKIATLSFGAKTKLSLLVALARRPELLVLDEPTTGLDALAKRQLFAELLKLVESGERTVVISSHNLSDLERFADHVGVIKKGRVLLEGRMDEVVNRFRLAEFYTEDGATLPSRSGLTVVKQDGNRWHAVIDQRNGVGDWLRENGAQDISLVELTLEDLFVALAQDEEGK